MNRTIPPRFVSRRRAWLAVLSAAGISLSGGPAHAATYYWDTTTTGLWSTGSNWSDTSTSGGTTGTVPANDIITDLAVFNQSTINGAEIVQFGADASITGMTFANTDTTLQESDSSTTRLLTIGASGITVNSGAGAVTIGDSTNTLNLALGASQSWTNNSSNTLTVTNAVTNTANTSPFALTIAGSGNTAISGAITNGGSTGTVALTKSGSGTLTLSGTNSYSGATTISAGTLKFQGASAMSTSSALSMANGTTLALQADADTTFAPATFSIAAAGGTYNMSIASLSGSTTGKTFSIAAPTTTTTGSSATTLNVSGNSGEAYTLKFTSAFATSSNNGGAWSTSSNNIFNLTNADVVLNAGMSMGGNGNGGITLNSTTGNTLTINGVVATNTNRTSNAIVNSGTLTLNNTVSLSGTNQGFWVTLNGGTLNINNAGAIRNNSVISGTRAGLAITGGTLNNTSGSAITLTYSPTVLLNGDFSFGTSASTSANSLNLGTGAASFGPNSGTSRTITVNGSSTLTIGGAIASGTTATGLTKAGTGTLALGGVNTYTGATVINNGTLKLGVANALATGTSITLGGGTLNLGGFSQAAFTTALTMTAGSTIDFGSHVTGITLTFADSQAATWTGNLTLLNFTVGTDNLNFTSIAGGITTQQLGQITLAGYTATGFDGSGNVQFTASAVPEPATYAALAGLSVLALAAYRRRRAA